MADKVLEATPRTEMGKNASRRLRARGRIPAVVYGHDMETVAVSVDPKDVVRILQSDTGRNTIFQLQLEGKPTDVLIRDYQLDPVKGNLIHADFQRVVMDEAMVFEVPIEVVGTAKGVKLGGGVLDLVLREIEVECLPGDVPEHIEVEVSELDIGDALRVSDLKVDTSKVQILSEPDLVVLTVVPPRVEEALPVTEEEMAEPELVRKGKAEAEEEEEGEAAEE